MPADNIDMTRLFLFLREISCHSVTPFNESRTLVVNEMLDTSSVEVIWNECFIMSKSLYANLKDEVLKYTN